MQFCPSRTCQDRRSLNYYIKLYLHTRGVKLQRERGKYNQSKLKHILKSNIKIQRSIQSTCETISNVPRIPMELAQTFRFNQRHNSQKKIPQFSEIHYISHYQIQPGREKHEPMINFNIDDN